MGKFLEACDALFVTISIKRLISSTSRLPDHRVVKNHLPSWLKDRPSKQSTNLYILEVPSQVMPSLMLKLATEWQRHAPPVVALQQKHGTAKEDLKTKLRVYRAVVFRSLLHACET